MHLGCHNFFEEFIFTLKWAGGKMRMRYANLIDKRGRERERKLFQYYAMPAGLDLEIYSET